MYRNLLATAIVIGTLLVSGCKKNEQELPKTDTMQQSQATQPSQMQNQPPAVQQSQQSQMPAAELRTNEATQADRDTYMKSTREEIDKLKGEIDAMAVKAKNSSAELKVKMETKVKSLRGDLQMLENKFGDIKNASATAWQEAKNSLNDSMEKLRNSIKKDDN